MEPFNLHILGCGSAKPTLRHNPTAQVLVRSEKMFMIDCGEGTQLQMRRAGLSFDRVGHVFISHLHGDHCFGLIGLVSTMGLLGRTRPLHVYAPEAFEGLMRPWLDYFCGGIGFDVVIHVVDTRQPAVIYEDNSLTISTLPLRHRMPCCGFLLREKPSLPHIRRDMMDYLGIPHYEVARIKAGGDWVRPDTHERVPHERLVTPAAPPRSYAYCSDTAFFPELAALVQGVDLLYHEATFATERAARARETFHSTAAQAATIASLAGAGRLVIGHFSARFTNEQPLLDEARAVFPATTLATEGLVLPIRPEK